MTTDDLRTRAEMVAKRAWPDRWDAARITYPHAALQHYRRGAFVQGALWHATQQPSRDIDVDELVVVLHDAACVCDRTTHPAESWVNWTNYARAVVAHLTKGDESDE